jgi:hypothetical protein
MNSTMPSDVKHLFTSLIHEMPAVKSPPSKDSLPLPQSHEESDDQPTKPLRLGTEGVGGPNLSKSHACDTLTTVDGPLLHWLLRARPVQYDSRGSRFRNLPDELPTCDLTKPNGFRVLELEKPLLTELENLDQVQRPTPLHHRVDT